MKDLNGYIKLAIILISIVVLWFIAKYLVPSIFIWLLPIIAGYFVSAIVRQIAAFLTNQYNVRKKAAHIISYFFIIITAGLSFGYIIMRIVTELVKFAREVPSLMMGLPDFYPTSDKIRQSITALMPIKFERIASDITTFAEETLHSVLSGISGHILSGATCLAASLPDLGLFAIVFIISSFFFSVDYDRVSVIVMLQVPKRFRTKTLTAKKYAFTAITKYLRGMITMSAIVYLLLLIGFLILGIKYTYLTALLVAIVDFFPLLGTGIVLIPWGILCIITGSIYKGLGILCVWGCVMIIRQLTEPKIMGKALGLHPLVTLIAAYTGYKMYGFFGAVLFPIIVLIISYLKDANIISLWKSPQ
ncbi:MAG: sporulation integral membrane protein YtvI [Eubacteriales bacterium]|nr:sporulation integral membrane protein YtvI [Eubacteriales bacterium]